MITHARANRELQRYNLRLIHSANGYFDFYATKGAPEETYVPNETFARTPDGLVDVTVDQMLNIVREGQ